MIRMSVGYKMFLYYGSQLFPFVLLSHRELELFFLKRKNLKITFKNLKTTFSLCLQTMLTSSSWLICYIINFLGVNHDRKSIRNAPPLHSRYCICLQRFICIPLSCPYVPCAHLVLPYVKTHVMDKICTKGVSLSAEPKPGLLWSCAHTEPAGTEKIPGVFPVVVV